MTVYSVKNSNQLNSALAKAVGGDTITLAAGNYGAGDISSKNFTSAVTIKSASSLNKAHFDSLQVNASSNLRFEGLDVGHALKNNEPEYSMMMRVADSSNVKLVGMAVHGSLDNNPANDGIGLYVVNSSNVQLMGSSFRDLFRGATFEKNTNVTVSANNFQMLRSDGVDVGAINGITIDKNYFSNFHPVGSDHPDAIQFWQVNQTTGSSNITITNNTVLPGAGVGTQGIFISDPNAVGYSNLLIQNNLLYGNDQYHGISVDGGHGVQILGNTVLSSSADSKTYWIQLYGGTNFTVKDNVTDMVLVQPGASGVSLSHNLDFAKTPALRSLIPNLNAPTAPKDLIIADYGYHVPGNLTASTAPVATALAQNLFDGSAASATSAKVAQIAIVDTVAEPAAAPAPKYAEIFASSPQVEESRSAPVFSASTPHFHHFFDHFTAIA